MLQSGGGCESDGEESGRDEQRPAGGVGEALGQRVGGLGSGRAEPAVVALLPDRWDGAAGRVTGAVDESRLHLRRQRHRFEAVGEGVREPEREHGPQDRSAQRGAQLTDRALRRRSL
ncbi:hypothetical protein GS504_00115, partial [Rhodococcus hoagii]|nr:hypothetical protein [Prescottella equi]